MCDMGTFKVKKLAEGLILVEAEQRDLTRAFVRIEEFYESPYFKGKVFTLEEFKAWYRKFKGSRFSYFTDWSGFNIPSHVWRRFFNGSFQPLSSHEAKLYQKVQKLVGDKSDFYVIGICGVQREETLLHELVHALFFLSPEYKKAVREILKNKNLTPLKTYLLSVGYSKSVLVDEINAYLVADAKYLKSLGFDQDELSLALQGLFYKHAEKFNFPVKSGT